MSGPSKTPNDPTYDPSNDMSDDSTGNLTGDVAGDDAPLPGSIGDKLAVKKPRRWPIWTLSIALILSLGLNLALAGFIAGRLSGSGGGPEGNLRRIAMTMESDDRQVLRKAFVGRAGEFRQLRQARRSIMRDVRRSLRADPFDPDQLEAALSQMQSQLLRGSSAFQSAMMEAATNLSPEAREKLAGLRMPGP